MNQLHTTEALWRYFEVNELILLFHPYLPKRKINKEKKRGNKFPPRNASIDSNRAVGMNKANCVN